MFRVQTLPCYVLARTFPFALALSYCFISLTRVRYDLPWVLWDRNCELVLLYVIEEFSNRFSPPMEKLNQERIETTQKELLNKNKNEEKKGRKKERQMADRKKSQKAGHVRRHDPPAPTLQRGILKAGCAFPKHLPDISCSVCVSTM